MDPVQFSSSISLPFWGGKMVNKVAVEQLQRVLEKMEYLNPEKDSDLGMEKAFVVFLDDIWCV